MPPRALGELSWLVVLVHIAYQPLWVGNSLFLAREDHLWEYMFSIHPFFVHQMGVFDTVKDCITYI